MCNAARFLRAALSGNSSIVAECCSQMPELKQHFSCSDGLYHISQSFFEFWQRLASEVFVVPGQESSTQAADPAGKSRAAKNVARLGRPRPSGLDAVWDPGKAAPGFTRDEKVTALNKHWEEVLKKKPFCQPNYEKIMSSYKPDFPSNDWLLKKSYLEHLVRHPKKSAGAVFKCFVGLLFGPFGWWHPPIRF